MTYVAEPKPPAADDAGGGTGGGGAHNNVQPTIVPAYMISTGGDT